MTTCEFQYDARPWQNAAEAAPRANGDDTVVELTPSVSHLALDVPQHTRRRRIFRLSNSLLVSLVLHSGALAVLASPAWRAWRRWELQMPRGHNSPALAASVASPRSEATMTVQISQPQAAAVAEPTSRRESELPDTPAAQFASAAADRRVPLPAQERRRSDVEEPARNEQPESARPKQTAEVQVPQRDAEASVESPASNPSAASSGATRDVPPTVVREVRPAYPPAAEAAGMQGVAKFHVRVNHRGEVLTAVLHQSSGYELLDRAALEAILQYQFAPFEAGTGVAAEFIYPIRFRLNP